MSGISLTYTLNIQVDKLVCCCLFCASAMCVWHFAANQLDCLNLDINKVTWPWRANQNEVGVNIWH